MKRIIVSIFMLILVSICLITCIDSTKGNIMTGKAVGKYSLAIENDSHHGFGNFLSITGFEKNVMSGVIGIDWSLGPEGRAPMEWERLYELPFQAELKGSKAAFEVEVAKEYKNVSSTYRFEVSFIDKENLYKLQGKVSVKLKKDSTKNAEDHNVVAERLPD